jgi:hypothetical protein
MHQIQVLLRPTVSRPFRLGVGSPFGAHKQILIFFVCQLLSSSRRASSLTRGRVCNLKCNHAQVTVAQGLNHNLLPHLKLPQPGGPGLLIYISHEQGGPAQSPSHVKHAVQR